MSFAILAFLLWSPLREFVSCDSFWRSSRTGSPPSGIGQRRSGENSECPETISRKEEPEGAQRSQSPGPDDRWLRCVQWRRNCREHARYGHGNDPRGLRRSQTMSFAILAFLLWSPLRETVSCDSCSGAHRWTAGRACASDEVSSGCRLCRSGLRAGGIRRPPGPLRTRTRGRRRVGSSPLRSRGSCP